MKRWRRMQCLLFSVFFMFISGCDLMMAEDDLLHNKYLDAVPLCAPGSSYVGTWTTNMVGGLLSIRINPDGTGKYCKNHMNGTGQKVNSKIYKLPTGDLFLINEVGTRYKIDSFSKTEIKTTAYGEKYKFIPGVHSLNCKDFLG